MDHINKSESELRKTLWIVFFLTSSRKEYPFSSSFISHFCQVGFLLHYFSSLETQGSFWSPLFEVLTTADTSLNDFTVTILANLAPIIGHELCHCSPGLQSLHLIPLVWNNFTKMPLISHFSTVQEATKIFWHLFHCKLWIHNKIYEFLFLAYHGSVNKSLLPPIQYQQQSPIWGKVKGDTLFRWTVCKPGKHSLWGKPAVCSLETKGRPAYIKEVTALVPDWSIFMQMINPNLYTLVQIVLSWLVGITWPNWLL